MTLKKREFTPESGSVDTYVNVKINVVNTSMCLELIDIVRIVIQRQLAISSGQVYLAWIKTIHVTFYNVSKTVIDW